MLGNLKERLGFGDSRSYGDDYLDDYDEYADDYDDYDAAVPGSSDDIDSRYDSVTTRSAGTNRPRRSSYTSRASQNLGERRSASGYPALVSMDDVRATTKYSAPQAGSSSSVGTGSSYRSSSYRSGSLRNSVGRASDYTRSGAEIDGVPAEEKDRLREDEEAATAAARSSRSHAGYNSLFDSSPTRAALQPDSASKGAHASYDPYQAYEGAGTASHKPTREVIVIAPQAYAEVENVARTLKAGDAVVLSLHDTPNQLAKRILDFSFGVASALDARVDCIADKVFAITRPNALTETEIKTLRAKGVM